MEKFLRVQDVADMLAIGKSTVWLYTKTGKLPQPIKLSPKVTVWKLSEIEQFMSSLK